MHERRQTLRVKQRFQDRIVIEIVLMAFIVINLLVAAVLGLTQLESFLQFKLTLGAILGGGEFLALGVIYWFMLRSSHRIAGPIFALEKRLGDLGNGDLTGQLKFRDKDHFHETGEVFNRCTAELRRKLEAIRDSARQLQEATAADPRSAELSAQLLEQLNLFKTEGPSGTSPLSHAPGPASAAVHRSMPA